MTAEPPLLLHVFPSFATGGAQMRFAAVVNRFGTRWRHVIVAMDGDREAAGRLDARLDVRFLPFEPDKTSAARTVMRCRRTLRELRPDLLVTTNWGAIEWALANLLLPLAPHLHIEEGLGPDEAAGQFGRRVWTRRVALRRSLLAVPSHGLERMAADPWRHPRRRTVRIPNGVDLSRFAPRRSPRAGPLVIGTVSALRREKNLPRLVEAFAILRRHVEARLVIVGDGPERERVAAAAEASGHASDILLPGSSATPEAHYAGFDIFALASDTEQMPLCVLEAMACGLPVASTAVGDVADMVARENRPFVVERSAPALARALLDLAPSRGRREAVGQANRARAEAEFDAETSLARWGDLFDAAALRRGAVPNAGAA